MSHKESASAEQGAAEVTPSTTDDGTKKQLGARHDEAAKLPQPPRPGYTELDELIASRE